MPPPCPLHVKARARTAAGAIFGGRHIARLSSGWRHATLRARIFPPSVCGGHKHVVPDSFFRTVQQVVADPVRPDPVLPPDWKPLSAAFAREGSHRQWPSRSPRVFRDSDYGLTAAQSPPARVPSPHLRASDPISIAGARAGTVGKYQQGIAFPDSGARLITELLHVLAGKYGRKLL